MHPIENALKIINTTRSLPCAVVVLEHDVVFFALPEISQLQSVQKKLTRGSLSVVENAIYDA